MTLENFFHNNPAGLYSIHLTGRTEDGWPCFSIHPDGVNGDTVHYYVIGDHVFPVTEYIEMECN